MVHKRIRRMLAVVQWSGLLLLAGCTTVVSCDRTHQLDIQQWTAAPLRVSQQMRLEASPEEIFDYISQADTLPQWMPGLESLSYDHGQSMAAGELAQGSQRTMMFGEQSEIEDIVYFDRPHLIAYQILEGVPVRNHLAIMTVEEREGASYLTWSQYFDVQRTSVGGWLMPLMVRSFVKDAQDNLIKHFGGAAVAGCHGQKAD
ncbi:SRPBCC family protein [Leptolyngbya cf. ectocarpi LEGE 11479]|uniref:SRPBCC family protein n=1 Tax=Leptolyngbya cf. ectocarpi LEGE 11479 TaxID=1828722 RepID=A0A928ZZI9_LEPEC|nr:SRPBCC family protein [Leptolyngbya ectocarpi]MBE9070303.1 SRPBCC family protein [Leptolyngbya cf. ectocarpi LEGE 11479]